MNSIERIGFRFSSVELRKVIEASGFEVPEYLREATEAELNEARDSLIEDGIIESAGDRFMTDRVVLMVLIVMLMGRRVKAAEGRNEECVLYKGKKFLVMSERRGEMYCLTPLETEEEAEEAFEYATRRFKKPKNNDLSVE